MVQFIQEYSIEKLIGLDTWPEDEKTIYLQDMVYTIFANSIVRYIKNESIPKEKRDALENEMSAEAKIRT